MDRAMATVREMLKQTPVGLVFLVAAAFAGSTHAPAQNVDLEHQILRSLMAPPAASPSATDDTSRTEERKFLNALKNRTTRSLTLDEREHISEIAKERPSVDVEIKFDYRSAKIGPVAVPSLVALGKALTSPELKGTTFFVAGHTDAKGSIPFNQDLSEKRADAVKRYLVEHFQIPASNLITVGYGKSKLKNEKNPLASENRRAQIVNIEEQTIGEK
jgi:outer membrane protein OmpA-like peptidoglycan-associated protein